MTNLASGYFLHLSLFSVVADKRLIQLLKKLLLPWYPKNKVGQSPGSVESADFNNDKFNDLAVTSETTAVLLILLGNGKGGLLKQKTHLFCRVNSQWHFRKRF